MINDVQQIVLQISQRKDCEVLPSQGLPTVGKYKLPPDLEQYYLIAGEALIHKSGGLVTHVAPPDQLLRIDDIMWGDELREEMPSSSWFAFADDLSGNYVSIDLDPNHWGHIYDTEIGRYGSPGYCSIIALSFSEFMRRTLETNGEYYYWTSPDFVSYGDAYEGLVGDSVYP